jgi:ribosomal protein S18 acetylase RimI-like enzyme
MCSPVHSTEPNRHHMESSLITVRPLSAVDIPALIALRRTGLEQEPHSFGASPEDDRTTRDPLYVERALLDPDQALLGAFAPGLVGMVGIYRDHLLKAKHKAHIWGMYVSPEGRGKGTGKRLMEAALQWAERQEGIIQVNLIVSAQTPVAQNLYRSLGFTLWGTEPSALRINGELVDDQHMVKTLSRK